MTPQQERDDFSNFYDYKHGKSIKVQVISFEEAEVDEERRSEADEDENEQNYQDLFYNDDEDSDEEF